MKFTLSWLKKFLDIDADLEIITENLTNIGLELEEIIDRREELKDFSVAEIMNVNPHPSANKLQICEVQTKDSILQIVCGAPNARSGIKVILAPIGSIIPNGGLKIKESEIRGVKSCGMLCSAEELLIGYESDGIVELPKEAKIGDNFANYYGLDDPIIHINVTPNRGDCLGVYSIARDLAAKGIGKLKELNIEDIDVKFSTKFNLQVENQDLCHLFSMIEIRNLKNKDSPLWLKRLLENIGIGSISPVVDVTNYICFSFNQPMHAYDADLIQGGLYVKSLKDNIKFNGLNKKTYELNAGDLVISDNNKPQCLAGIIGGTDSACSSETKNIILEAASFDAITISKTGRRLQIDTDSRYRFERKIDRDFTVKALKIAANMIISICGGEASNILISNQSKNEIKNIELPLDFMQKRTGLNLPKEEMSRILEKLGFKIETSSNHMKISVPGWRNDISIKEDIVEEILRIYGYDKLPEINLPRVEVSKILTEEHRRISDTKRILASQSYDEVVTWSFLKDSIAELFAPLKDELFIINPISDDLNYMRPNILPNLLKIAAKNQARSIKNIALFEVGPVFKSVMTEDENIFIAGIKTGFNLSKNPHEKNRHFDLFDIKEDLENLLSNFGFNFDKLQINQEMMPSYYHPARSSSMAFGKNIIGHFGQIHPSILKIFEIEDDICAFEINLSNLPFSKPKFGKRDKFFASDFQPNIRDFAFIIDKNQKIGEILSFIKNIDKNLIKNVDLFDIYEGANIEENKKSIAISVQIQSSEFTLSEEQLTSLSNNIISFTEAKFNCKLRL